MELHVKIDLDKSSDTLQRTGAGIHVARMLRSIANEIDGRPYDDLEHRGAHVADYDGVRIGTWSFRGTARR